MESKGDIAARRLRAVADALFVLSMSARFRDHSLERATTALRGASLHNCLHVVRGAHDIPFAVVFVAALSDEAKAAHEAGQLDIFAIEDWVSGRNPVVLEVISLDSTKDAQLAEQAKVALSQLPKQSSGTMNGKPD